MLGTRPTTDQIRPLLEKVFPDASVFDIRESGKTTTVMVCSDCDGVYLRYDQMPRIAEAMETEHLDFRAQAGTDVIDSFSFDGCVLYIFATYKE